MIRLTVFLKTAAATGFTVLAVIGVAAASKGDATPKGNAAGPMAPALAVAPTDSIGFHGAGPLLGSAGDLHAPPLKVRWKLRVEDVQGLAPTSYATQPTTQPATAPSHFASGHFEGGAAIVDGIVYVGDTAGDLRAIVAATGKIKWTYRAEDGFETTPLVVHGRVLLGDLGGVFHAVAAETGKKLWTFDSGSSIHSSANYLGPAADHVVFGNDGADIYCLDAATGKQIWDDKAGDRINGAPAVAHGAALVSGCDSQLRALKEADGAEQFSVDLGALCPGSAAVAGDHMVLGTDGGRVMCISSASKKTLWLFEGIEEHAMVYSSPAVADGVAVVGARDRNVYGLDLATGKKLWSFAARGDVDASPVISAGRVWVGSKDKRFYALDLKSGKMLWTFIAGRGITATAAVGAGVVVFGDTGGNLFCLE